MTHKITMIAGSAIAAMAAGAGASAPAAAEPIPQAASYADLFEPVPDAMFRLQTADAQHVAGFQEAQYYNNGRDHHHHHHQVTRSRRWYQSHGYSWYGGRWQIRPRHHHHHHHHSNF